MARKSDAITPHFICLIGGCLALVLSASPAFRTLNEETAIAGLVLLGLGVILFINNRIGLRRIAKGSADATKAATKKTGSAAYGGAVNVGVGIAKAGRAYKKAVKDKLDDED